MPTIKLREREWEVKITFNGGYESDTNAHVIEWQFVDDKPPTELTDHEEQSVFDQLYDYLEDREADYADDNVI